MTQDYKEVIDRLGSIDVKLGILDTKVDGLHETNNSVKDDLKEHGVRDMWIQGTLITLVLAILGLLAKVGHH